MRETELLAHIERQSRGLAARWPRVLVGPGDDCAVVHEPAAAAREPLLLTVDQLVEGRHFAPATSVDLIARKAVARSISDIAAMGGRPAWSLGAGVLPRGYSHARELTDALHHWADFWAAPMVGGDLAEGPTGSPLVLSVTVGGAPHADRGPVLRSQARVGDEVWVTGAIGGSFQSGRHLTFNPRLDEAAWLCRSLGPALHAMIDLSDGLGRDAARIAAASGVRIELESHRIPLQTGVHDPAVALRDGEDYELLFTAAPGSGLASQAPAGTPLACIGRVVAGAGCAAELRGRWIDVAEFGWDHGQ